eukprot:1158710-Pelagomonas_calceolata.AAC.5
MTRPRDTVAGGDWPCARMGDGGETQILRETLALFESGHASMHGIASRVVADTVQLPVDFCKPGPRFHCIQKIDLADQEINNCFHWTVQEIPQRTQKLDFPVDEISVPGNSYADPPALRIDLGGPGNSNALQKTPNALKNYKITSTTIVNMPTSLLPLGVLLKTRSLLIASFVVEGIQGLSSGKGISWYRCPLEATDREILFPVNRRIDSWTGKLSEGAI